MTLSACLAESFHPANVVILGPFLTLLLNNYLRKVQNRKNCRQRGLVADNAHSRKKKKKQAKCQVEHTEISFISS